MTKFATTAELKEAILQLENKQALQQQLIKDQVHVMYASLNPVKMIIRTIREAIASPETQNDIIDSAAMLTADFVSQKIMKGTSENNLNKYLRQLIHYSIATFITNSSGTIRSIVNWFVERFITDKEEQEESS